MSDTRWLSFESVARRTIEQWIVLQHYFIQAQYEEKVAAKAEKIKRIPEGLSLINKIYLKFLVYILNIMNKLNKNFQSEVSQIIYLISSTKQIILEIYSNFLKKEYLTSTKIEIVDYLNKDNIKNILNIYIRSEAEAELCKEKLSKENYKYRN